MSREWKPGDVAERTYLGSVQRSMRVRRGIVCGHHHPRSDHWHHADGGWDPDGGSSTYRPLAVIDPEDEQTLRAIGDLLVAEARGYDSDSWMDLQAALREFADSTPPRPDEPTGLGAVVEDTNGCLWIKIDEHKACNDWTPIGAPSHDDPEQATGKSVRWHYADIAAVKVLSDGVQADD